ncbi:MAG: NDP-sugar synthase [Actinomycetota bacterium]|nr:NDP-sugar synthase [Actinomycetota bacterium]
MAKPALPLLDVPLGAWGLSALDRSCPPAVVNASHLPETVVTALELDPSGAADGAPAAFVERPHPFGTGGTLHALRDRLADQFVTWNSDSLTDLDVEDLLFAHERNGALATIAVIESDAGDFEHSAGRVTGLVDRRVESKPGPRFIGVAVYERDALRLLSERRPLGATEGLLRPLLERGELVTYEHFGYWLDVGTPGRYLEANLDVVEGRAPPAPRDIPGEIVDVAGGRAYVGPGASADAGSVGPGAVILAGGVVEAGARVAGSVVWPGERVPSGMSLDRCVWFGGAAIDA